MEQVRLLGSHAEHAIRSRRYRRQIGIQNLSLSYGQCEQGYPVIGLRFGKKLGGSVKGLGHTGFYHSQKNESSAFATATSFNGTSVQMTDFQVKWCQL